jgi:hypothetical protein
MLVPSWFVGCRACGDAVTFILKDDGWYPRRHCRDCHKELIHGVLPNVTRTKARQHRRRS